MDAKPRQVGLICGGGAIPALVAAGVAEAGERPVLFCLVGECEPSDHPAFEAHPLRFGEVGKLFRMLGEAGCDRAALVGSVRHRPSFREIRIDSGAALLAPRLLRALAKGDDGLLRFVAELFVEHGVELVSPLDLAPSLALREGLAAGPRPGRGSRADIEAATRAARAVGALDIGQAAVAVNGRVVAVEGAEGTDGLLTRVGELKRAKRVAEAGGVLVKCMKPRQDRRLDIPTVGPETAALAAAAGLDGVALEAGRCLIAGRAETVAAFNEKRVFLVGIAPPDAAGDAG